MTHEITPPTEGKVTMTLDWYDAEILARIIGTVNSGNLRAYSPKLYAFATECMDHFGVNTPMEAENVFATVTSGQIYLADSE